MLLNLLITLPLLVAALAALLPSNRWRPWLLPITAFIHLFMVVWLIFPAEMAGDGAMLGLDALGRLVLLVVSLLYAVCSLYAPAYFKTHPTWSNRTFVVCLLIFLAAVSCAAAARHLGLLWVAAEATTVASAPMIYFNRNRYSIEATWKYLLFCSVGIALAMLGILFLAYAGLHSGVEGSLQLDTLLRQAHLFSKPWLRAGFVFLLVGFGAKMGLAPLHTWKPDAYGEAPGLAGALMSGGLTSVAFLAVLRSVQIMNAAGEALLARQCLLGLGILSLFFAALFVIRQRDIKRLLAYSSVEHMGILAIGVALGGIATYGALLHLLNNALAKGALFMSAGNIHRYFGSKRMCETQGAVNVLPWSGSIFLVGFLAIAGSPPFGPFISEFTILRGIFGGGHLLLGMVFIALLTVIFIGMSHTVMIVSLGPPMEATDAEALAREGYHEGILVVLPPLLLLGIVLLLGLYLPEPLRLLLGEAAGLLEVRP